MSSLENKKIIIIGGGLVGLALAKKLSPMNAVTVLEKETSLGKHQSGNNSGVLHCGLPYQPGSLKARLATSGVRQMVEYCRSRNVPHEICGKVMVASDEREDRLLKETASRGEKNGLVGLRMLSPAELKKREPHVHAYSALLVPEEGIVDYPKVMDALVEDLQSHEGVLHLGEPVVDMAATNCLRTEHHEFQADYFIFCGGIYSDRLFERCTKEKSPVKIVPFRGEYFNLVREAEGLFNHLVYPVPDPNFPFLGVHFTRMINGTKEVGPNAVLALSRQRNERRAFTAEDAFDALRYPGLYAFLKKNFIFSLGEFRSSLSKGAFLAKARKLIPDLEMRHITPGGAGIRAQTMEPNGTMVMDFRIERRGNQIHVLNAPSPGATASLAIADYVLESYLSA